MKSEERHKLQQNALADWIGKTIKAIEPIQTQVLVCVCVVLLGFFGYSWWTRTSAFQATRAWNEVCFSLANRDFAKLAGVVADYPNTNVAYMAAVIAGDRYLAEGCNNLFVNKPEAKAELSKAIDFYDLVLGQTRFPGLHERAMFGLARAREANDDLEKAMTLYQEVSEKWPNGAFGAAAARRLEDLKRPAAKEFYDQFAKFEPTPKPVFTKEPDAGAGVLPNEPPTSLGKFDLTSDDGKKPADEGAPATDETPAAQDTGDSAEKAPATDAVPSEPASGDAGK